MKRLRVLPLVVLGVLLPLIASAEMYQWVDGKGVKHYSNSPPPVGIKADSSWGEIKYDEKKGQAQKDKDAEIVREAEAANRQAEAEAKTAKPKNAQQEALDAKKAEQKALGESISQKRRYVKRRGKTDINKIKRLNEEIAELKKNKNADPEKIKELEAEVEETKEKFYHKSGRGRKGTKEEVQRHRQLNEEIREVEK
jgi:hypothetical protein